MRRIFNFFYKNLNRFLFLVLLVISFTLTIQSHSYHRSKVISATNLLLGGVNKKIEDINQYLSLSRQNDSLTEENAKLLRVLFNKQENIEKPKIGSVFGIGSKNIVVSKVMHNSYNLQQNYLTIDTGFKDGVKGDMGVINNLGIVGIIDNVSPNFARVTSILNTKSLINAKIKNSSYFGTLTWNGKNTGFVQLIDVPRTLYVKKGDTIVTGGISDIFPENVDIGTVDKVSNQNSSFIINIKLFNDMTDLGNVYILKSKNK